MQRVLAALPDRWLQRYQRWLDRRIPARSDIKLHQGNLFIFLSRQGMYFLLLVSLVWIGATNFQNNLAYALSFFLLGVLFVAILQTFSNASGLRLRFIDAAPVLAGDEAVIRFEIASLAAHQQLELAWPEHMPVTLSVAANEPRVLLLPLHTTRRGWLRPGRLRFQTVYPLGIVRCWSWLDLGVQVLVYPAPVEADYRLCSSGQGDEDAGSIIAGGDEFFALKPYVEGEARSRIAWKQYAAGRGLFVREYAEWKGSDLMLDFSVMTDADLELRLSKLCYCARQLHQHGRAFGLLLPGAPRLAPAAGDQQLHAVLSALALYQA
ncbi:MAG TPA: DUF58 domain-containing protein [Pseudomonadales bacterium]|nr:DUF58 domain-containing protein [Pseudomonadales bacterium]